MTFFPYEGGLVRYLPAPRFEKTAGGYRMILKRTIMKAPLPERLEGVLAPPHAAGAIRALLIDIPLKRLSGRN